MCENFNKNTLKRVHGTFEQDFQCSFSESATDIPFLMVTCGINRKEGWMLHVVPLTKALLCVIQKDELRPLGKQKEVRDKDNVCADLTHEDLYFPSVDLLTAQVLTLPASPHQNV